MKQESYQVGNNFRVVHRNYEPAMTFDEIAVALGSNRRAVFVVYARAMEKIRRQIRKNPQLYRDMWGLVGMRNELHQPTALPAWGDDTPEAANSSAPRTAASRAAPANSRRFA